MTDEMIVRPGDPLWNKALQAWASQSHQLMPLTVPDELRYFDHAGEQQPISSGIDYVKSRERLDEIKRAEYLATYQARLELDHALFWGRRTTEPPVRQSRWGWFKSWVVGREGVALLAEIREIRGAA